MEKMKIGIITLPTRTNYGGILQAYALSKVLQSMGHNPYTIYIPIKWKLKWYKKPYVYLKRFLKKLFHKATIIFLEDKLNKEYPIVSRNTWKFVKENIPYLIKNKYCDIKESEFDCLIVGSDQIWRPQYISSGIECAYLDFAKEWNIKRIAYAVSFGTDQWEYTPKQTNECNKLIHLFDKVSVREKSAISMCQKYYGITPVHVLDPTLLLDKEDYTIFCGNNDDNYNGDILNYILDWDYNKTETIAYLEKTLKLKSFKVNSLFEDCTATIEERIQPSVEQWITGFKHAKIVITDSFHACVFSIIFNKPFYVIGNAERGMSRFYSLLSIFNLENRLIKSYQEISMNDSINWEKVNKRRIELQKASIEFLKKSLS